MLFLGEFPTSPWKVTHSPVGHDMRMRTPLCSSSSDVAVEGKKNLKVKKKLFTAGIRILRYPLTGTASIAQITYSSLIDYILCCSSWSSAQVRDKSRTSYKAMIYACVRNLHFVLFLGEFPTSPWKVTHSPVGHDMRKRSPLCNASFGVSVEGKNF